MQPSDVAAVVCTMNSISGVEQCLLSLRDAGVGQIIVVDARSSDGTRAIAEELADLVLDDPGTGLGNARNVGIARTTLPLILNMGSDNVMPPKQLDRMIQTLIDGDYQGVSARTIITGSNYASFGLNAWRKGRFTPGERAIIGTPTLFIGDLLRCHPFDTTRVFSDDSELCERWRTQLGARFAISDAYVEEVGKTSWHEVWLRCRMYGISDAEIFSQGSKQGWSQQRKLQSVLHPAKADLVEPLAELPVREAVQAAPFLAAFTTLRYASWLVATTRLRS